jgi:hypothetical protein
MNLPGKVQQIGWVMKKFKENNSRLTGYRYMAKGRGGWTFQRKFEKNMLTDKTTDWLKLICWRYRLN